MQKLHTNPHTVSNMEKPTLETFEEYWKTGSGIGGLDSLPSHLVIQIANSCYVAVQNAALKWCDESLQAVKKEVE